MSRLTNSPDGWKAGIRRLFSRVFSRLFPLFKFGLSAVACAVLDEGLFYLLSLALLSRLGEFGITVSFALARGLSSIVNFIINRKIVFKHRGKLARALLKYYALAAVQFAVGAALLNFAAAAFGIDGSEALTLAKFGIDCLLFLISFTIQRLLVFNF